MWRVFLVFALYLLLSLMRFKSFREPVFSFLFRTGKRKIIAIWLFLSLLLWLVGAPLVVLGVLVSGFLAFLVWHFRMPLSAIVHSVRLPVWLKFLLLGGFGAVVVEVIFWLIDVAFNSKLAAHPNLLTDLAFTMPWYLAMTFLLYLTQTKHFFPLYTILFFGGVYSFFAEGIVKTLLGQVPLPLFFLFAISFPSNILSYSFIVLTPTLLLRDEIKCANKNARGFKKNLWLFLPFVGILIYIPVFIIYGVATKLLFAG